MSIAPALRTYASLHAHTKLQRLLTRAGAGPAHHSTRQCRCADARSSPHRRPSVEPPCASYGHCATLAPRRVDHSGTKLVGRDVPYCDFPPSGTFEADAIRVSFFASCYIVDDQARCAALSTHLGCCFSQVPVRRGLIKQGESVATCCAAILLQVHLAIENTQFACLL